MIGDVHMLCYHLGRGSQGPHYFISFFWGGGQNLLKVDNLIRARSLKK